MRITFSNPLELGRTGAGRPYGYLYDHLVNKQKEHEVRFVSGMAHVRKLFGATAPAAESLEQGSMSDMLITLDDADFAYCDVFLGCGCASLQQIREINHPGSNARLSRAETTGKFPKIITTWFSTHYVNASRILTEEYAKVGMDVRHPVDPFLMWRDKHEQGMSDVLLVPSEACAETYEADPICRGKTRIVPFGVDCGIFHPTESTIEDFRVLFVGGNWVRKGLPYLIKAWNGLKLQEATLTLAGCNVPAVYTYRTAKLGFVGDEEVPKLYRKNNVFILPTLEEGSALAVLEAMASGCAVITTKEAGSPIEDGKDGLLIPSKDVQAIAGALKHLNENPSEVKRLGENARKKAETLTWERFGEAVVKVCEEVASK